MLHIVFDGIFNDNLKFNFLFVYLFIYLFILKNSDLYLVYK